MSIMINKPHLARAIFNIRPGFNLTQALRKKRKPEIPNIQKHQQEPGIKTRLYDTLVKHTIQSIHMLT